MPTPIFIHFYGTGGSTPFSDRNFPCIALKYEKNLILFDFGEYCQFSLLRSKIHPFRHDVFILITHFHADHTSGLPGLIHTLNMSNIKSRVTIVGPSGLEDFFKCVFRAFLIGRIYFDLELLEIKKIEDISVILERENFTIYAFPTEHSVPSVGYIFKERDFYRFDARKADELGIPKNHLRKELMEGKTIIINGREISPDDVLLEKVRGRKIVYTGDTVSNEMVAKASADADLLIHEATFLDSDLDEALYRKHSTVGMAIETAEKANVKKLALVHISSRYKEEVLQIGVEKKTTFEILIPHDGVTLEL
ncbi:MAG: ribonuclease Z [Candidatus Njordarchaeia archaeon]